MITVIVGHRGSGKKTFLKRLRWHLRSEENEFYSLDTLIEDKIGNSIQSLFTEHGERYFRKLEKQVFTELIQKTKKSAYIVVSSGFDLSVVSEDIQILWLQRKTDRDGRILLGRSIVHRKNQSLKDFHLRAEERNFNFLKKANWIYEAPEGEFKDRRLPLEIEYEVLFGKGAIGGYLEVDLRQNGANSSFQVIQHRYKNYLNRGVKFVINLDQISILKIQDLKEAFGSENMVLNILTQDSLNQIFDHWDLFRERVDDFFELHFNPKIEGVSILNEILVRFSQRDALVMRVMVSGFQEVAAYQEKAKAAKAHFLCQFSADSFSDFEKFYHWREQNSENSSLLPTSIEGRWDWVSLFLKSKQKIAFWREGFYGSTEHPSLFEWIMTPVQHNTFGVSLGDPIYSAPSLNLVANYFNQREGTFFQVAIKRSELSMALLFFLKCGASVVDFHTPLMDRIFELSWPFTIVNQNSKRLLCDSIFFNSEKQQMHCFSAEANVLPAYFERLKYLVDFQKEVVVWSHRERLTLHQSVFPHAIYYSARTGELRAGNSIVENRNPKILIWDAQRATEVRMPPKEWAPDLVIDLSLQDNSPGREYADTLNCAYIGGQEFMQLRTQRQVHFWKQYI